MMPLNYAVLKYFASGKEADADDVMQALAPSYSKERAFKKKGIIESLMTAKENGLLDETKFLLEGGDSIDNLRVYYKVNDYGLSMINSYIRG